MNTCIQVAVKGEYTVQVRIYSYSNPTESCVICIGPEGQTDPSPRCCDTEDRECIGLEAHCDTFYRYCLRPLGTTGTSGCSGGKISTINENDAPIDFSNRTVLGLRNPFILPGLGAKWKVSNILVSL